MLGAAFLILTVAVLAGGHYLAVRRPNRPPRHAAGEIPIPLHSLVDRIPGGVFVQPTFTWGHLRPGGDVELGVHPLLLALLGPDAEVTGPTPGSHVSRDDELLTIREGDRSLALRSPLSGRVTARQSQDTGGTHWDGLATRRGQWSVLVAPDALGDAVPTWMLGPEAIDWTRKQYRAMRDFFVSSGAGEGIGVAMADGGDIPRGALADCGQAAWTDFSRRFLDG